MNEEGQVLLEMSGEVILNPDEELAQIFEVRKNAREGGLPHPSARLIGWESFGS